ncbi:hypothetical protein O181_000337 [Austropuccinia psidii MF-1]|uniref:Uncharacterized protein n=1 Tax=Austropuccinia psidii MF-1 TaxID=1389203 RepID=A0A9Q3B8P1_9BASI|nr:hypothetical protein [Austropuccinia psidii MF-1]
MVRTRNGSKYSVQPDGSGKGRGNTRDKNWEVFFKEDPYGGCQTCPPSLRSVPTASDINSEPDLIQGNVLRVKQFPSGTHRNKSVPLPKLVQRSQARGMENFLKPLEGDHELLFTHKELSGPGGDHRTLRGMESLVFQGQCQRDKELVEELNSFIHRPEERVENDPRFGEGRPSGINQPQASFRSVQRQSQRA